MIPGGRLAPPFARSGSGLGDSEARKGSPLRTLLACRPCWRGGCSRLLCLCVLLGAGFQARASESPVRVAVLPVSLLAAPAETGDRARNRLFDALRGGFDVEMVPAEDTDRAVDTRCGAPTQRWDCLEQDASLLAIGRSLDARVVVAGNLAVMGETQVLKLRVLDLSSETVTGEVVEMTGANDEAIVERFVALNARLFPHPEPTSQPELWPVWAGVGAAVVALALGGTVGVLLATGVLGTTGPDGTWDVRVRLP